MSNLSITQLRQSLSGLDEKFFDKYGAHSISVGLKEVGGELTKKVCIRFAVEKKLSSEQLDASTKIEKIPDPGTTLIFLTLNKTHIKLLAQKMVA